MSKQTEKFEALAINGVTHAAPETIRAAGIRAAEAGKRFGQRVDEVAIVGDQIRYKIKGPGGLVTQANFTVAWAPANGGGHLVALHLGTYLTVKGGMFTPKKVPAIKPLESFIASIRADLAMT